MNIISIHDFRYSHSNRELLFENLAMQVNENQKVALVGRNGIGKTTLLKAIFDHKEHNKINVSVKPYYIPQHIEKYDAVSVASALNIEEKLDAIKAIAEGESDQSLFDIIGNDWDIEERSSAALAEWGLENLALSTKLKELSGGEKMKVFLSGITIHSPKLILLDEPSNHLDYESREQLYNFIRESSSTFVIVSHDRYLLNLLTDIYELTPTGINVYTGDYDSYAEQKRIEAEAIARQISSQQDALRKAKRVQQEVVERRQRQDSRGAAKTSRMGMPKIVAGMMKGTAERTTAALKGRHDDKISQMSQQLSELRQGANSRRDLKFDFESSDLHKGKIMAEAKNINFSYGEANVWGKNLDFLIQSGERVLITGANGSGKSTLIKLLTKQLQPTEGELKLAEFDYLYLDQNYSLIDSSKTVYQQAQSYNEDMAEHDVKILLTRSQFERNSWDKLCGSLSGGEKMKLSLCSLTIANKAPDLFILDEPTNNLDIESLNVLSAAVGEYIGTLLVVSHDRYFVGELGIDKKIELNSYIPE